MTGNGADESHTQWAVEQGVNSARNRLYNWKIDYDEASTEQNVNAALSTLLPAAPIDVIEYSVETVAVATNLRRNSPHLLVVDEVRDFVRRLHKFLVDGTGEV